MSILEWRPLADHDLDGLRQLAQACLAADGGLPLLESEPMLRALFLSGPGLGGWDETGELVAAAGLTAEPEGTLSASALVHPQARAQGHGSGLYAWARERAGGQRVRLRLESVPPEAEEVLAGSGLVRVFTEIVQRHDLQDIPRIPRPAGIEVEAFDAASAPLFHRAYRESFATRPGFPDTPEDAWLGWLADEDFLPKQSRVALADGEPVGFVTVSAGWIDQVGVVPAWRGRRLGAHLVVRSLRALRKRGDQAAWLCVNEDNPDAAALYRSLGFVDAGLRARYEGLFGR